MPTMTKKQKLEKIKKRKPAKKPKYPGSETYFLDEWPRDIHELRERVAKLECSMRAVEKYPKKLPKVHGRSDTGGMEYSEIEQACLREFMAMKDRLGWLELNVKRPEVLFNQLNADIGSSDRRLKWLSVSIFVLALSQILLMLR